MIFCPEENSRYYIPEAGRRSDTRLDRRPALCVFVVQVVWGEAMRTTLLVALLVVVNLAETSHAGDHVVLTTNVYKPYVMQGGGVTSGVCADIVS